MIQLLIGLLLIIIAGISGFFGTQLARHDPSQPKRIVNEPGIGYRFNLLS